MTTNRNGDALRTGWPVIALHALLAASTKRHCRRNVSPQPTDLWNTDPSPQLVIIFPLMVSHQALRSVLCSA